MYFTNQINDNGDTLQHIKPASFFRAVQLFDKVVSQLERKDFDHSQVLMVAQTCILMSSKINDIYQIGIQDLEKDLSRVRQVLLNEKEIIRMLNFDMMFTTEVDCLSLSMTQLLEVTSSFLGGLDAKQFTQQCF